MTKKITFQDVGPEDRGILKLNIKAYTTTWLTSLLRL